MSLISFVSINRYLRLGGTGLYLALWVIKRILPFLVVRLFVRVVEVRQCSSFGVDYEITFSPISNHTVTFLKKPSFLREYEVELEEKLWLVNKNKG